MPLPKPSSFGARIVLTALAVLPALPLTANAAPAAQSGRPIVSTPVVIAEGEGNQTSPSLAGRLMAFMECISPMGLCGARVQYLNTGQTYSIAQTVERSYFGGEVHTDARTVVWTDGRNKQSVSEPAVANANDNTNIYSAHLSDFAHVEVVTAPGRQWDARVAGSIVVWSDC